MNIRALGWCAISAAALSLAAPGAMAAQRGDALALASDQEQDAGKRLKALRESIEAMKKGETDARLWREAVKKIAWKASNPAKIRIPAIEALVEQDEADSRSMLALMIPREPQRPVVDLACDYAARRGWGEMTPAIVRSWSRKMISPPEEERSERAALIALHPDRPLPDIVFEVFAAPVPESASEQSLARRARADAWTLLCRIDPERTRTRELLAGAEAANASDPTLLALREAAQQLGAVPATGEQLDWLLELRSAPHAGFLASWRDAVASLTEGQRAGLELRHGAALVWAAKRQPAWLGMSRDALLAEASGRLKGRKTHRRQAETAEGSHPKPETIEGREAALVWGDALAILAATEALADPAVVASLFEQVDTDREDKTTEYGGLIDASDGAFVPTLYPPRAAQRAGDGKFIASPEMIEAGAASLFQYHFHARSINEREYAGPSDGDIEYAARFGRHCLVLTSIGAGTLGVDYYQPDGAVVDLGEIRRESGSGAPATR